MAITSRDFGSLRLDRISRDFGQTHALRDVAITVERGEFIALLGPSGCGKSTALNCIAGLLQLTDGAIWLDDRRDRRNRPGRSRLRHGVPELRAVSAHDGATQCRVWTGHATSSEAAEITRRVDEALALVRLTEHADKLPGQLSGGQQQRVAIARAIVVGPPLVLMDEPLSNLDAKLRLEMRAEVRRIHAMLGCSTIYVTHDQEEALSLADRILVLIDGQTRQIGTPEELYARPATPDVAEFMGYRNLFRSPAEKAGNAVIVGVAGARLTGTPVGTVGAQAMVAIRPEDLRPTAEGRSSRRWKSPNTTAATSMPWLAAPTARNCIFAPQCACSRASGPPGRVAGARAGLPASRRMRTLGRRCVSGCRCAGG